MNRTPRLLFVIDDHNYSDKVRKMFHSKDHAEVEVVHSIDAMRSRLKVIKFDVVILDFELPYGSSLEALSEITSQSDPPPVLVVSGKGDESLTSEARKRGTFNYLDKGDDITKLLHFVNEAIHGSSARQAELEAEARVHYQSWLLDNVDDAIVVADQDYTICYWNKPAEDLLGASQQEALGNKLFDVLNGTLAPSSLTSIKNLFSQNKLNVELEKLTKNGNRTWIDVRVNRMAESRDGQNMYIVVFRDVTQWKFDGELQRIIEAGVENANFAVVITGADGHWLEAPIVYVNPVFTEMTGYSVDEIKGEPPKILFGPKTASDVLELCRASLQRGETFVGETTNYRKDGSEYVIEMHVVPVRSNDGKILNWISLQQDITTRVNQGDKIQPAQLRIMRAARLSALGELANSLAHQINNPMTTILGEAQILTRELEVGTAAHEAAKSLEIAGWQVTEIMRQLMDLTDPSVVGETVLDINTSLLSAVQMIGSLFEQDGTLLKLNLSQSLPKIIAKERDLLNAWINLLLVARDSASGFENPEIRMTSYLKNDEIQVSIEFPGDLSFLQSDNGNNSNIFGLPGYALGAEFIHQCGGSIEIVSKSKDEHQLLVSLFSAQNTTKLNKITISR